MPVLNLNERSSGGSTMSGERPILPTDIYRMKIIECGIEENKLDAPNKDGSFKKQIVITWEMAALTEEQQEIADERGEDWSEVRVWQRMNPYYGDVKDGGPSKFKAFIDKLRAAGYLPGFDLDAFDTDSLVGAEMRVSVSEYLKTMGPNVGKPGNKVLDVTPLRQKGTPKQAPRNVPQPIGAGEEL